MSDDSDKKIPGSATKEPDSAMKRLEDSILKGTIFNEQTDILSLAKANGFTIFSIDMDDAYGSISIDDENILPGFSGNMAIGLNAKKNAKQKKEFVAQELCRYFALRQDYSGKTINLKHSETLILTKAIFEEKILGPAKEATKGTTETKRKELIHNVVIKLNAFLSRPTEFIAKGPDSTLDDWDVWGDWGDLGDWETKASYKKVEDGKDLSIPSKFSDMKDLNKDNTYKELNSEGDFEDSRYFEKSEAQEEQEKQIAELLGQYVRMYGLRERKRIESRRIMLWFCMIMAGILICASVVLIFMWMPTLAGTYSKTETQTDSVEVVDDNGEAVNDSTRYFLEGILFSTASAEEADPDETELVDPNETTAAVDVKKQVQQVLDEYFSGSEFESDLGTNLGNMDLRNIPTENTSQPVKDIVAVISIFVTILGSFFGLLHMIAKYVLPVKEEERMHTFVDSLQRDSFKRGIVCILGDDKKFNKILSYLKATGAEEERIRKAQMELESKKISNRLKALAGKGPLIKTNKQIAEDTQGSADDGGK